MTHISGNHQHYNYAPGVAAVPGAINPANQVSGHTIPYGGRDGGRAPELGADVYATVPYGAGNVAVGAEAQEAAPTFAVGQDVVVARSQPGVFQQWKVEAVDQPDGRIKVGRGVLVNSWSPRALGHLQDLHKEGLVPLPDNEEMYSGTPTSNLTDWEVRVATRVAEQAPPTDKRRRLLPQETRGLVPFKPSDLVTVVRNDGRGEERGWEVGEVFQDPDGTLGVTAISPDGKSEKTLNLRDLALWQAQQANRSDFERQFEK